MGLCKCPKRKVTNLFCFEHDVNVCEYCLVSEHERCIVQSYVQWLQDSDYNPICILCKNLLKEEPTIRLICYDVFHWSCIDKYASQLPANTAPAGYQCPKCKECLFPPSNLVSPVVEVLKKKLETVNWSRVGLGQSLLQIEEPILSNEIDSSKLDDSNLENSNLNNNNSNAPTPTIIAAATDDESNGFVIVNGQSQHQKTENLSTNSNENTFIPSEKLAESKKEDLESIAPSSSSSSSSKQPQSSNEKVNSLKENTLTNVKQSLNKTAVQVPSSRSGQVKLDINRIYNESSETSLYHNRANLSQSYEPDQETSYDPTLGMVLNIKSLDLDRDTGEYKYQRRPLFEWLSRWLKSRQISARIRMTRQKKILFIVIFIFICLFTLIIISSRLGSLNTENDPALDPFNNPNIRINE